MTPGEIIFHQAKVAVQSLEVTLHATSGLGLLFTDSARRTLAKDFTRVISRLRELGFLPNGFAAISEHDAIARDLGLRLIQARGTGRVTATDVMGWVDESKRAWDASMDQCGTRCRGRESGSCRGSCDRLLLEISPIPQSVPGMGAMVEEKRESVPGQNAAVP